MGGPDPGEDDSTYTDFAALIGMRQQWRWGTRFTPFWQLLGGGLFSNGEGRTCSCGHAGSTDAYLQGTSIFPRTTVGAVIRLLAR